MTSKTGMTSEKILIRPEIHIKRLLRITRSSLSSFLLAYYYNKLITSSAIKSARKRFSVKNSDTS